MTEKPLSILHVLAPADVGGLETVVRSLALGHTATGHSVEIAAVLAAATNPFVQEARNAGLQVHVIDSPPRSFLPERRGIRALLAQKHFDVLHSHGYRSDILDLGVARRMRVASVTTLHGFSATDTKARAYEWLQLRAARGAAAVVAVSSNIAQRVVASGVNPRAVHLIRNAAPDASMPVSAADARGRLQLDDGLQLGWIGRLSEEKGPDIMVEAMSFLSDLPITLSFIGDGPDRLALASRADDLSIAQRVRFHGRVPNAASLLRGFDLVVLTSRTEGTPMVLLEAMAADVPIIATGVGGVPDMLSSAEAILVPPEDPKALADAVRVAMGDMEASRERAGRAHERLVAEFSTQAWLDRYETLYRSIQHVSGGADA